MAKEEPKRVQVAPGLVIILLGLALLAVGAAFWLGWAIAATVVGALLTGIGLWSAFDTRSVPGDKD
jgi:hypothetical protein